MRAIVSLNPDLADRDAARSVISAKLYDDEKLSGAYGAQYIWVPRTSDQRRTLQRGYRVRFVSVFVPPTEGSYRLQFFGYGQTRELPYSSSPRAVEAEIHKIHDNLQTVEVDTDPLGLVIYMGTARIGIGATAGRMIAQGGVGVCLVNRDFSQPLRTGTPFLMSPRIPFETEDEMLGLHNCINLALADITAPDLVPVASALPANQRSSVIRLSEIAPWAKPEMVLGFYGPTDWLSVTRFRPPASGTYLLRPVTVAPWATTIDALPYNATGAEIQNALQVVVGSRLPNLRVAPSGLAPEYNIAWQTLYHEATIEAVGAGAVVGYQSNRLRQPYPITVAPGYQRDFEAGTFTDPGYGVDQSWFIEFDRPASTKICPQVWPRKRDGSYDYTQDPLPGNYWVDSTVGLVHDLDQAMPPVSQVAPAALRYACLAIANVAPAGEAQRWEALAQRNALHAAARVIYGTQRPKALRKNTGYPPLEKSWPYFQPSTPNTG